MAANLQPTNHPGPLPSSAQLYRARSDAGVLCFLAGLVLAAVLLAGCRGVPVQAEKDARQNFKQVGDNFRPSDKRPALPALGTNSNLGDYLRFAVLNQPKVEAAYYDWAASVERITTARSLPDPALTFQSDISDMVTSLMPGLMMDLPGPGKLKAAAGVAAAESDGKYAAFESSVLEAAYAFKKAYYELYALDARLRINRQTQDLLAELEALARSQNEVGKVTLQDVLKAQIEQEKTATELTNLEDSRSALITAYQAALGLATNEPVPPLPAMAAATPLDLTTEELLAKAMAANPRLRAMEADVRRAEANLRVAYKDRMPDFGVGLEADAKASPVFYRPQAYMTLPLWRDKIAADIAAAQAEKKSAQARLTAEQLDLAVDFTEKSFEYRESSRNLESLRTKLLPKSQLALQIARAAYLSGQLDFLNLIDAERTYLDFQMAEVETTVARETTLAELSLLILAQPPAGSLVSPQMTDRKYSVTIPPKLR